MNSIEKYFTYFGVNHFRKDYASKLVLQYLGAEQLRLNLRGEQCPDGGTIKNASRAEQLMLDLKAILVFCTKYKWREEWCLISISWHDSFNLHSKLGLIPGYRQYLGDMQIAEIPLELKCQSTNKFERIINSNVWARWKCLSHCICMPCYCKPRTIKNIS